MTTVLNNTIDQEMMGQKTKFDQKMKTGFSFQILDVLPNKNFLMEYSIRMIKINMNINGQDKNFDSESTDGNNPLGNFLKILPKIKIEITPLGKIVSMEEYNLGNLQVDAQIAQFMLVFLSDKNLESFIGQMFNYFPEDKVEKGDKWTTSVKLATLMNMATNMNFELTAIEKDLVTLKVTSDVNMNTPIDKEGIKIDMKMIGTQYGSMTLDPKDCWVRSFDLTQKFNLNMKSKDPKSKEDVEIPVISNSVTKFTVVKK